MDLTVLVPLVVATALLFDFTNGFHDTANAMATSIATGALRPRVAVALSAVLNLAGAFLSVEVAKTISGGVVDDAAVTPEVVFGGLVGAIVWNLLTWYVGLPSSSSHALFGGLIGAAWVVAGGSAVHFGTVLEKVLLPALVAPVVAGVAGGVATYLAFRITRRATASRTPRGFRIGQVASASLLSLAHGTNDAQKTMGIITLTLISAGSLPRGSGPPVWVVIGAGVAIAAGTYLGGWRIIRTLGSGITDIGAPQGFAAQTSATAVILTSSHMGIALSTTHVCSGGILGAGLGTPQAVVRWGTAGRMVLAWLTTLPAAGAAGALAGSVASTGAVGTVLVAVLGVLFAGGIYLASRRDAVGAHNVNDIPVEPLATSGSGGER
ncbi:inorganic phosphate transporter [Actinokineospora bangkokensis]|uniref:Phosphate transporter n=1 Tax=Actinokineospora bangkokensis TaxID=1193682 RepID=A0A1Q9LBU0_9PSEU|nr:inorganic phosphate transporter [Actinokineospora bangkokensis]OLR89497.1 phosphate transporter [Actinokineospora bangkokensis]